MAGALGTKRSSVIFYKAYRALNLRVRSFLKLVGKPAFRTLSTWKKQRFASRLKVSFREGNGPVVISVVKNEALRLPFFIEYYTKIGIEQFIVIDHGSTDDTANILDAHKSVSRVPVTGDFSYKTSWIMGVLEEYCHDRWVLLLDADEILVWPNMEQVTLSSLLKFLEDDQTDALECQLLDMFPRGDLADANYRQGQDPIEVAPYFDVNTTTRARIFGVKPLLYKVPVFRFRRGMTIRTGQHDVYGSRKSKMRACLLHFKFLQDFKVRNTHSTMLLRVTDLAYGRELNAYRKKIEESPSLSLWSPSSSVFTKPSELVDCEIMRSSKKFDDYASNKSDVAP